MNFLRNTAGPTLINLALLFELATAMASAQTIGVWYQPTPTPPGKIPHVVSGWLGNVYNTTLVQDTKLVVGGWGDTYATLQKFDLEGLPQNVSIASHWLMPFSKGDGSTPTPFNYYQPTLSWNSNVSWSTLPSTQQHPATFLGSTQQTPASGHWFGGNVTGTYNAWASSVAQAFNQTTVAGHDWRTTSTSNNGFLIFPWYNNNNFDNFWSTNTSAPNDGVRPGWYFEFPRPYNEPDFRLPLPGGRAYVITSEIGGYDCSGKGDPGHQDIYNSSGSAFNYFALDIVGPVGTTFTSTPNNKTPILASAAGFVDMADSNSFNGNYIVIRHTINGFDTGYSTLYLHLDSTPRKADGTLWARGNPINQGDRIGFMGNTGKTSATVDCPRCGVHLHFAVRYGDASPPVPGTTRAGAKYIIQLTNATMERLLFKSYQTDCGVNGGANTRLYGSSNLPIP